MVVTLILKYRLRQRMSFHISLSFHVLFEMLRQSLEMINVDVSEERRSNVHMLCEIVPMIEISLKRSPVFSYTTHISLGEIRETESHSL